MAKHFSKKYILVLPSWYPSRVDKFNGDFNERLVQAVSADFKQVVLYVVAANVKQVEHETELQPNVVIHRVYYPSSAVGIFNRLLEKWYYQNLSKKYIKKIVAEHGSPMLVHCYVFLKSLLIGKWAKHKYKVPLVLTEHWSAFLKGSKSSLHRRSFFFRSFSKVLLSQANQIIAVSNLLSENIRIFEPGTPITVIPNVVDTNLFKLKADNFLPQKFRFVHVSSMFPSKNVEGMLDAFEALFISNKNVELWMVGAMPERINAIIQNSSILKQATVLTGELSYLQVADIMAQCRCLLMFSNYETFSCVTAEALCCGLPVIVTDKMGITDYVDNSNGLVVPSENKVELLAAMLAMIENYNSYNRQELSKTATSNFSYENVKHKILDVYHRTLN